MAKQDPIAEILTMTMAELLAYVVDSPELLNDSYYREFGDAIRKRAAELSAAPPTAFVAARVTKSGLQWVSDRATMPEGTELFYIPRK